MRGSPLIRLTLVLAGLALLVFPLRRLTSRVTTPPLAPVTSAAETPNREVHITLTSTSAPFHFTVNYLGRTLWAGDSDSAKIERSFSLAYPKEGIDLVIEAEWPVAHPAALQIEVDPGNRAVLFGTSTASDVFTFR